MTSPITPEQAIEQKLTFIPDEVIAAVNRLIIKNLRGRTAKVLQKEITDSVAIPRQTLYDNGWLDFEPLYRQAGWDVTFDKPGWDETYDPYFEFTKK